jgi:hypothetical protein
MRRTATPLDLWMLGVTSAAIAVEANMVVAMRVMGMMGGWSVAPGESLRMVTEKQAALAEAGMGAASAMARGASPVAVARAAAAPVRRRTKANVKRLTRLGPKVG